MVKSRAVRLLAIQGDWRRHRNCVDLVADRTPVPGVVGCNGTVLRSVSFTGVSQSIGLLVVAVENDSVTAHDRASDPTTT